MSYRLGEEVYYKYEDDVDEYDDVDDSFILEFLEDDDLHFLKLRADMYANECTLEINRGKDEYERNGRNPDYGLSPAQFKRLDLKRQEAQTLIKAIEFIKLERSRK